MVLPRERQEGEEKMEKMEKFYVDYTGHIRIDADTFIVSAWNKYVEEVEGGDNKIFLNDKNFFEENISNAYDAAMAVALSGAWRWADKFVCFDDDGYLTSFSHWDDVSSPVDVNKIDISFIRQLQDIKKRYVVNNIPREIHEALQHDALQE